MAATTLLIAAASRSHPHETVSGDAWTVQWQDDACRVAVIDGLGHGPEAARVAQVALAELAARPELPPDEALRRCHRALAGTRGAAVSIATIAPRATTLSFAGVGNVEGRLWQPGREQRLMLYRGILGSASPIVRRFDLALGASWLLLLHTDGVSARFTLPALTRLPAREPQALADRVLAAWAQATDDATVVVVCPALADA